MELPPIETIYRARDSVSSTHTSRSLTNFHIIDDGSRLDECDGSKMPSRPHAHRPHALQPLAAYHRRKLAEIKSQAVETVRHTQQWMHKRFAELTPELFSETKTVIFSTEDMQPPPGFEHLWFNIGAWHRMQTLSDAEADCLIDALGCIIFCDFNGPDKLQSAIDIAESIGTLELHAPAITLAAHSVAPEFRPPSGAIDVDKEFAMISDPVVWESGIYDVVYEEPSGFMLALEVQSRMNQQRRNIARFHKKVRENRAVAAHAHDLWDCIDDGVWNYLRLRLKTGIPGIGEDGVDIEPGVPSEVDGFRVGAKLGQGSFGVVCKLVDPVDNSVQVIKMCAKKPLTHYYAICQIKRQLAVLDLVSCELNAHENVAKLYQVYQTETHLLFRMEYGGPLDLYKRLVHHEHQDGDLHLSVDMAKSLMGQCIDGLCHLHINLCVAHCDLKPENIIVREHEDGIAVKISDFDTAQVMKQGGVCSNVVGTFPFMSPEVVLCQSTYDPLPADIWSLGMVFLEVVCRLDIVKTALHLQSLPANASKRDKRRMEQTSMQRIFTFFAATDNVRSLLRDYMRPDMSEICDDMMMLHEGILQTSHRQRWTAWELHTGSDFLVCNA